MLGSDRWPEARRIPGSRSMGCGTRGSYWRGNAPLRWLLFRTLRAPPRVPPRALRLGARRGPLPGSSQSSGSPLEAKYEAIAAAHENDMVGSDLGERHRAHRIADLVIEIVDRRERARADARHGGELVLRRKIPRLSRRITAGGREDLAQLGIGRERA